STASSSASLENQNSKIRNTQTANPELSPSSNSAAAASSPSLEIQKSKLKNSPWNLYFRVTMPDAVELGLLDVINRTRDTSFTPAQFIADCQARSGSDEVYQQSYLCNPLGSSAANIVEWSAIERCREDYSIDRVHLESDEVLRRFGQFNPNSQAARETKIQNFLLASFPELFDPAGDKSSSSNKNRDSKIKNSTKLCLGFDVAASGQGDLAAIYIDEVAPPVLRLRALFTTRTEDWNF